MANGILRVPSTLVAHMRHDLMRPHPHAAERVGFMSAGIARGSDGWIVIGKEYFPVPDSQYVVDFTVGARIGTAAIREAVSRALTTGDGIFHVHLHTHEGTPQFSPTDTSQQPRLVESFAGVAPSVPHGMLVLSDDAANSWIWMPESNGPTLPKRVSIVGYPMTLLGASDLLGMPLKSRRRQGGRHARQSFLGPDSEQRLHSARVAIIGYGGGGSHFGQQLAHVGVGSFSIFDADHIDGTNQNRLIGGTAADVRAKRSKVAIAERTIRRINPNANVSVHRSRWQDMPEVVRSCDVVVGSVDTYAERHELEAMSRRFCVPYIDIGMDVHQVENDRARMGGQLILSMPGEPCMWCLGFLTQERLGLEAQKYGNTGGRPQVVWANGELASAGVGVVVDLITGWTRAKDRRVYLSYDGNLGTLQQHPRLEYISAGCEHYPSDAVGMPTFRTV